MKAENKQGKEVSDFQMLSDGRWVMSSAYLLRRGYCCGCGCFNCPYQYENVSEPARSGLLEQKRNKFSFLPQKGEEDDSQHDN